MLVSALSAAIAMVAPAQLPPPGAPSDTIEQAIARTVADSMPDLRYPWRLNWGAFGVRGGRDVFWHLTGPDDQPLRPLPPGVHRRTGWITVRGGSGSVAVCGDAHRIGGMTISIASMWMGRGEHDVIAQLSLHRVRATLLETRDADLSRFDHPEAQTDGYYRDMINARPALQRWRLERDGHQPVDLAAVHTCTPPGTRHATHCWVTWQVTFLPDDPLPGADCPLPGRYGG